MLRFLSAFLIFAFFVAHANAVSVSDLTNTEASSGLKTALIQGADKAVTALSKTDGFLGNEEVKIPLPDA
jgi:hypothetical protein